MYVTPRYRYHYEQQAFEPFTVALVSRILKRARLFVDVGAHYGFFTMLAAAGNSALDIVAAEPVPETFSALKCNVDLLGASNVTLHQIAISDAVGRAPFIISTSSDNCGFYPHPNAAPLRTADVETSTVDTLVRHREPCPLVIKIDTDGHELAVLGGMSDTLRRFDDVTMIIEFNPKMQRAAGRRPEELLEELDRLEFETFLLDDVSRRAYRLTPTGEWPELMNPAGFANLYCVRRCRALSLCLFAHNPGLAGAERSLLELVDELIVDHGVLCTVVLPANGPLVEALERVGAACIISEYSWWCGSALDVRAETEKRRHMSLCIEGLVGGICPVLAQIDPDVVWTQTMTFPWGAVIACLFGKPHVWSVCEYGDRGQDLNFFWRVDQIVAAIAGSSNLIYTASQGVVDEFFCYCARSRSRALPSYIHSAVCPECREAETLHTGGSDQTWDFWEHHRRKRARGHHSGDCGACGPRTKRRVARRRGGVSDVQAAPGRIDQTSANSRQGLLYRVPGRSLSLNACLRHHCNLFPM